MGFYVQGLDLFLLEKISNCVLEEVGEENACASPNKGNLCNVSFRVQMVF